VNKLIPFVLLFLLAPAFAQEAKFPTIKPKAVESWHIPRSELLDSLRAFYMDCIFRYQAIKTKEKTK